MNNYGLTRAELNEMDRLINGILSNQTNVTDTESGIQKKDTSRANLRAKIIFPKQKLGKLRYYFDNIPREQLTKEELEIIKTIVVKPKSTEWNIVRLIILHQQVLSEEDRLKWFSYITPMNRNGVYATVISVIQNEDFRFEAFKGLLAHINYIAIAYDWLTRLPGITDGLRKKVMDYIFDLIELNDSFSKDIIRVWSLKKQEMDKNMETTDRRSILLYNAFKEEKYLPATVKEIFLF